MIQLIAFSFPLRYVFENFAQFTVTSGLELASFISKERRNLNTDRTGLYLLIGAGVIMGSIILFLCFVFFTFLLKYRKLNKRSILYCFKEGMNPSARLYVTYYFFQNLSHRLIISMMIAVSSIIDDKHTELLWLIIGTLGLLGLLTPPPFKSFTDNFAHLISCLTIAITVFALVFS